MTFRKNKEVNTPNAPQPDSPYSQAIVVDGWVYLSGQAALSMDSKTLLTELNFEEQARMTFEFIKEILEAAGSDMDHVVKVNGHISNEGLYFGTYNKVYKEYFSKPYPARITLEGGLSPGIHLEVDVIARVKE